MKRCSKCGLIKPVNEFTIRRSNLDGLDFYCRVCNKLAQSRYYEANVEKLRARSKEFRDLHPETVMAYRKSHRERDRITARAWRKANPEKIYIQEKRRREKKLSTARGKLNYYFSNAMRLSLNGYKNYQRWERLVGYTVDQLKKHLEKQFIDGMTWETHGKYGWHIDHKIPISAFNFETFKDVDFKRCWALKNLQPMWAKENIRKGARVEKPFQPSLTI